jgi:hypothetical protein
MLSLSLSLSLSHTHTQTPVDLLILSTFMRWFVSHGDVQIALHDASPPCLSSSVLSVDFGSEKPQIRVFVHQSIEQQGDRT